MQIISRFFSSEQGWWEIRKNLLNPLCLVLLSLGVRTQKSCELVLQLFLPVSFTKAPHLKATSLLALGGPFVSLSWNHYSLTIMLLVANLENTK